MPHKFPLLLVIFVSFSLAPLPAQPVTLNFQHLTPADGLSHTDVLDILQDRRGFIWLATRHGLNRYDGHSFRTYFANQREGIKWSVRIGIHSGPITVGVIGKRKFSYDLFGDTINVAARIESAGEPGKINVSAYTYTLIKDHFPCTYRGKIDAKGKGELDMYFVD